MQNSTAQSLPNHDEEDVLRIALLDHTPCPARPVCDPGRTAGHPALPHPSTDPSAASSGRRHVVDKIDPSRRLGHEPNLLRCDPLASPAWQSANPYQAPP